MCYSFQIRFSIANLSNQLTKFDLDLPCFSARRLSFSLVSSSIVHVICSFFMIPSLTFPLNYSKLGAWLVPLLMLNDNLLFGYFVSVAAGSEGDV